MQWERHYHFQERSEMESYRDHTIAEQLVERCPPLTVGYSPHFDDLVNFVTPEKHENVRDFIPFFLRKFQVYNEPTLATWSTDTPIDQAIICAFSHCMPTTECDPHSPNLPEKVILERFTFCVKQVHCLDYLDFIIRVLHVITDQAIDFEMAAWADYEEGALLAGDQAAEDWYHKAYLPKILKGADINVALDGATSLIKRTARMMEPLGDQYRKVVMDSIKLRPQHVAGSYFIANHVTQ